MPQIITTDTTSAFATILTTVADDPIFVAEGVLVSTTSPVSPAYPAIFILHDNIRVGVAGTAMSASTSAIYSYGLNTAVTVSATGSVVSMGSTWDTIIFASGGGQVFNDGAITGMAGAVTSFSGTATVFNTGLIAGVTFGVSGASLVENSGTIRGATAVAMGNGNDKLINTGELTGNVTLGSGEDLFDTIGGHVSGTVAGGIGDDVYRTGTALLAIVEGVAEGLADRVESTVSFDLSLAANVENLTLLGTAVEGAGNGLDNTLTGNLADNRMEGAGGSDTINGQSGDDRLLGDGENDLLNGGTGDDVLRGGGLDDTLNGGEGDDLIKGDAGADQIFGNAGEDVLVGGAGRDSLTGGGDADIFRFDRVSDSLPGTTLRDQIIGFEAGLDVIALNQIDANTLQSGNQAFTWIGTAAFGNVAGQLQLVTSANSLLRGDVNGDGVADFELRLTALTTFNVNDILL